MYVTGLKVGLYSNITKFEKTGIYFFNKVIPDIKIGYKQ